MDTIQLQRLGQRTSADISARASRIWAAAETALEHDATWAASIALIVTLQLLLIATHVPWLDEIQALLIARQSPDMASLLENLRYEGHPPLWYILLRVMAQIAPLRWVLPIVSMGIALATQALILLRSPFPRIERLLLMLSEFVLVENGTISRGIALGTLFAILAVAFWHNRAVWVPLALLPMCDFLPGVVALLLIALRVRQRLVWVPGLLAFAATSALATWAVLPAPDMVPAESHVFLLFEVTDFVERIGGLAMPLQTFLNRLSWDGFPPLGTGGLLIIPLLVWWWQRTEVDRFQRLLLFGLIGFCFLFSIAVYPLHARHLTVIALFFVLLNWLFQVVDERDRVRWRIWLVSCALCGLFTASIMLFMPFDAAPHAAAMAMRLDDGRRPWLSFPSDRTPALFFNSGIRFVQPEQGCSYSFARWNHRSNIHSGRSLYRAMQKWAERYGQSFLVLEQLPLGMPRTLFVPLVPKMRGYDGQSYIIGILGPQLPIKPHAFPHCVANLRDFS